MATTNFHPNLIARFYNKMNRLTIFRSRTFRTVVKPSSLSAQTHDYTSRTLSEQENILKNYLLTEKIFRNKIII